MTAVANPPTFSQISRPAWGNGNGGNPMNADEVRGMFAPRKTLSRSNSASSISSSASNSSNTTVATNGSHSNGTSISAASDLSQWSANSAQRKRPTPKASWPSGKSDIVPADFSRLAATGTSGMVNSHGPLPQGMGQPQIGPQHMMRSVGGSDQFPGGHPMLYLLSLNGTFERKTIAVPFAPDTLRIGRQTNQKTLPTSTNGFFDSKVLSRQHAEIYAERNGKIYIKDVKSSNGTFVNGSRLSQENRESEPHELQTADQLELGIDIVSEDQKTVVHHKVAAKVEHAGFLSTSNNVMDMNFGDLDPANGAMMIPPGAMQMRARQGANMPMASNVRMSNGAALNPHSGAMPQQRPLFLTPVATDQILKRLANEMRSARLQAQDLNRTNQFVTTLLSKDDVKDSDKLDLPEPSRGHHLVNGSGVSFRVDPKARFSDPPAPPPQAPLPEKPDAPSFKRGPTERPKSGSNMSPIRPDNLSQIIHLTEALNVAKRDIDVQTSRMRELESMLQKEREAREHAEDLAKRLEASATTVMMNGSASPTPAEGFDQPSSDSTDAEKDGDDTLMQSPTAADNEYDTATALQSRIDVMEVQMQEIKEQMEQWKQRCQTAESERDADRVSLAMMVERIREQEADRVARESSRSRSRKRRNKTSSEEPRGRVSFEEDVKPLLTNGQAVPTAPRIEVEEDPTLSRANTITPLNSRKSSNLQEGHQLQAGLPYASMVGVVLLGMGMMAYLNGWQPQPTTPQLDR